MKTIKIKADIPGEGLTAGDVLSVDEFSAAALIDRGDAEAHEAEVDSGERVETIDDIVDPDVARNRRQMTATIVGGPSNGGGTAAAPAAVEADEQPAPTAGKGAAGKSGTELAAPGPNPAGGDAGGGPKG